MLAVCKRLIAYVKQFNRIGFVGRTIPQENLDVVRSLEGLLPPEATLPSQPNVDLIGAPEPEFVGVTIMALITFLDSRLADPVMRATLAAIDTNLFERRELSDVSSSSPSEHEVPDLDEPTNKQQKMEKKEK